MNFTLEYKDGHAHLIVDNKEILCSEATIFIKGGELPQINITDLHGLKSLDHKKCDALSWQGEYLKTSAFISSPKKQVEKSWLERAKKEAVKATSEEFDKFFKECINNMVNSDDKI